MFLWKYTLNEVHLKKLKWKCHFKQMPQKSINLYFLGQFHYNIFFGTWNTIYLTEAGKARGCSTNSFVISSLIHWIIHFSFSSQSLRRRHAQTVTDSTSSYKIVYVLVIKIFLNPEGHQNPTSGSKVTVILLKRWILPIGEVASKRLCHSDQ